PVWLVRREPARPPGPQLAFVFRSGAVKERQFAAAGGPSPTGVRFPLGGGKGTPVGGGGRRPIPDWRSCPLDAGQGAPVCGGGRRPNSDWRSCPLDAGRGAPVCGGGGRAMSR